jgi:ribosomal protein S18 acetylase RimI-like enzyme/predicted FMN-binding regulatory protein PaiB
MRRGDFAGGPSPRLGDRQLARTLFERAESFQLAGLDADGAPMIRALHGVVVDDHLAFHSSLRGQKVQALGQRVTAAVHETVALIPNWFFDAERACAASTYFLSAQASGVLEPVDDPAKKARVLEAMMQKLQDGGYRPVAQGDARYQKAIDGVLIARLPLEQIVVRKKLGQNLSPAARRGVLEKLWRQAKPSAPAAIELILSMVEDTPTPAFLKVDDDSDARAAWRLCCHLPAERAEQAARLVVDEYWNVGVSLEVIAEAHRQSSAWVGALTQDDELIATARAITDGSKHALIMDVGVSPAFRGRGVGQRLMRLLIDHPAVRSCRRVRLRTKDAQSFYQKLGFGDYESPFVSTIMQLAR